MRALFFAFITYGESFLQNFIMLSEREQLSDYDIVLSERFIIFSFYCNLWKGIENLKIRKMFLNQT